MIFLWQLSVVFYEVRVTVSGVLLEDSSAVKKNRSSIANFKSVVASYFNKPYSNRELVVSVDGQDYNITTDKKGGFYLEVEASEIKSLKLFNKDKTMQIESKQTYPVYFRESISPLNVISDIDDTILVSHTRNALKRISTLLFVSPQKRKSIPFTVELLHLIDKYNGRIFYVSKSESNLFYILSQFIQDHLLPQGNLNLTSYLGLTQLIHPKKGKDFKVEKISTILEHSPNKKFILIGDDSQKDIAVYYQLYQLYPEKIFKVFIRQTHKKSRNKKLLKSLKGLGVDLLYFNETTNITDELESVENYVNQSL